jgi:hypothetical protein
VLKVYASVLSLLCRVHHLFLDKAKGNWQWASTVGNCPSYCSHASQPDTTAHEQQKGREVNSSALVS